MSKLRKIVRSRFLLFISTIAGWFFTGAVFGLLAVIGVFFYYSRDLPDPSSLSGYEPPIVTRLYAQDGRLMAEYATEHRLYVPLEAMPKRLTAAFVAAEDKNFYEHSGVDFMSILRAAIVNARSFTQGTERPLVGGSTITQQVVKNFLLTNEKSLERKIKEAILSFRISRNYSKDRIMELYLNEIYLGKRSYGVAAAALNYFNKSLNELTIAEIAFLAGLPKGPANYDPAYHYDRAIERRSYVIGRMQEDGYITAEEADIARAAPISTQSRNNTDIVKAEFFAESVRRKLTEMYGSNVLYEGGLFVKTTLDPKLQDYADTALRYALSAYDQRHGYRGVIDHFDNFEDWKKRLDIKSRNVPIYDKQTLAVVDKVEDDSAKLLTMQGTQGILPLANMKWAREYISNKNKGPAVRSVSDVLKRGDVILVEEASEAPENTDSEIREYALTQIPKVNGALVAIDPHTGRILAMSGGYSAQNTEFNRATQARRQPGSAFKPFVYLAGLERGLTPASMILDAPISIPQGPGLPNWTPQNYSGDYLGNVTLRTGLEKSRNTMTVHLASMLGIEAIREVGRRFGIYTNLPPQYSAVLGARETTLMRLVNAYGMLVNGGKRLNPSIIERIDDRYGRIIYRRDQRECNGCKFEEIPEQEISHTPPQIPDDRETVVDDATAFQMVYMLQGVVQRGTAVRARSLNMPLGGKTGTTNDSRDAWFVGFSPDLVVGLYIGFDQPQPLGYKETGSSVALPGFIKFMELAKGDKPTRPFPVPKGIQMVKIDKHTGQLPSIQTNPRNVIVEAFKSYKSPAYANYNNYQAPTQVRKYQSPYSTGQNWPSLDRDVMSSPPTTAEDYETQQNETDLDPYFIADPNAEPATSPTQQGNAQYQPGGEATTNNNLPWGGTDTNDSRPPSRDGVTRYQSENRRGWNSNRYQRPAPLQPRNRDYGTGGLY